MNITNHSTIQTKRIELQEYCISTRFYNPTPLEVVLQMSRMQKALVGPESTETVEYEQKVATHSHLVPAANVDYLKVWLTRTFPLLTAPLFLPKLKEETVCAIVHVPCRTITNTTTVYVNSNRFYQQYN